MDERELTPKELAAIEALKQKLGDVYEGLGDFHGHDRSLLRFLRARDMNVDKAEDMLRKNVIWRKENNIEQILTKKISDDLYKRFPFQLSGYDEDGSYVTIVPAGKYDYRKVLENNEKEEFFQLQLKMSEMAYELLKYKSAKDNKFVCQGVVIADYEGFSIRQFASPSLIKWMKEITVVIEGNYPEILKTCYIINAPKVFEILFNLMKSVLTKAMMEKIHVYGSNSVAWKEALWKVIPSDQLPSKYGGSNTTCWNYNFDMGMDISPKLVTLPENEMMTEVIFAGQQFKVDFPVQEKGTTIHWNFKSDSYDIGFCVILDEEPEEIVSYTKCDAHLNIQKGTLPCKKVGTYTLIFDNSYSKFRSKTLRYVTKIESEQ